MENNIISQRLRRALFLTGMKQVDLVRATGYSDGKISSWVNGRYKPNAEALSKLAAALDVPADWLLGKDDIPASEITMKSDFDYLSQEERVLVEKYRAADDPVKRLVEYVLALKVIP